MFVTITLTALTVFLTLAVVYMHNRLFRQLQENGRNLIEQNQNLFEMVLTNVPHLPPPQDQVQGREFKSMPRGRSDKEEAEIARMRASIGA